MVLYLAVSRSLRVPFKPKALDRFQHLIHAAQHNLNISPEQILYVLPHPITQRTMRPWRQWKQPTRDYLPEPLRTWVIDRGSLTKRLIQACGGDFRVEPIRQYWGRASRSEAQILGINPRQQVYIREVALVCADNPWVYARTIIPRSTMTAQESQLKYLGNKSLGSLLFTHKKMRRGNIQITPLDNQSLWARRSLFFLSDKPLLVSEFFISDAINPTELTGRSS
jgi:chorismate--pyruvate lyase